jgi:eukaryotic-like serine/threonine-protein kinase
VKRISDAAIDHLREVMTFPDLAGTKYEIVSPIAGGGMGTVYRAVDRELDREVALKVLHGPLVSADAGDRMLREAKVLATLDHPGIVPVHDVGTTGDGRLFYTMKLVRGGALDAAAVGPRSVIDLLQLFQRICEPVAFAHARGIVHRDLKPSNIMVGAFGEVLVMDWGIAKLVGRDEREIKAAEPPSTAPQAPGHTGPGTVLGTPGYMSPEQARGDLSEVDERTDVYALGAVLQFLLTQSQPTRYHAVRVQAICRKAMAFEPQDRYREVNALAADVARLLEGTPLEAYPERLVERIERILTKYRMPIVLIMAYVLMRALLILLGGR